MQVTREEVEAVLSGGLDGDQARSIVRSELSVSRVMSRYTEVTSRPSGGKGKARCPVHQEKSASVEIDDTKGVWFCHGCRAGGDVFSLIMQVEGTTFPGALRLLAEELGLKLKERLGRSTGTVTDRVTGQGVLEDGRAVTFVLGPDRTPIGTLELFEAEDGLVYGPQLWDRETLQTHRERGEVWLLRDPEQVRRAAASGHPGVVLLGQDGLSQGELLERWGLGRGAVLVCAQRSADEDLARLCQQLPDGLRAQVPCFAARAGDLTAPERWADEQALTVQSALARWSESPDDVTELAWSLTRLRRRARDRDLFHPTPMRLQAMIARATGLRPGWIERQMREQRPVDPAATGRELGLAKPGVNDLLLATTLWNMCRAQSAGGGGQHPQRVVARVRELLGGQELPERSREVIRALQGGRLGPARRREYESLGWRPEAAREIPKMIQACAGRPARAHLEALGAAQSTAAQSAQSPDPTGAPCGPVVQMSSPEGAPKNTINQEPDWDDGSQGWDDALRQHEDGAPDFGHE